MKLLKLGPKTWFYGMVLTVIILFVIGNLVLADQTTAETGDETKSAPAVPLTEVEVEGKPERKLCEGDARDAEPVYSKNRTPESSAAVETITDEAIAAMRPRDVYDLIEAALGVSMWRQGARIHNFVKSRGDSLGIILDGVYLSTTEAQRVLGDLPVELIDSMKIVRDATVFWGVSSAHDGLFWFLPQFSASSGSGLERDFKPAPVWLPWRFKGSASYQYGVAIFVPPTQRII